MKTVALLILTALLSGCVGARYQKTDNSTSLLWFSIGTDKTIAGVAAGGADGLKVGPIKSTQSDGLSTAADLAAQARGR